MVSFCLICCIPLFQEIPKWRPIQAFVALTDTMNADEGGFEAAHTMHTFFDEWVNERPPTVSRDSSGQSVVTDPPWLVQ